MRCQPIQSCVKCISFKGHTPVDVHNIKQTTEPTQPIKKDTFEKLPPEKGQE